MTILEYIIIKHNPKKFAKHFITYNKKGGRR